MRRANILCVIAILLALITSTSATADTLNVFELSVENGSVVDGAYQVDVGDTLLINVVKEGEWENATVAWASSDAGVAYVNSGVVYAQVQGLCTITATATVASTGNEISASINVRVMGIAPVETTVSIRSSGGVTTIEKGETLQILADVSPLGVGIKWASSRPAVISVDDDGLLLGLKMGKSIISATATDGSGASDSIVISVTVVPTQVKINKAKVELYVGGTTKKLSNTATLRAKVKPSAANGKVTWTSSNNGVVMVGAKGKIVAQKKGTAVITATTVNGLKDKCTVMVYKLPTIVQLPALKKVFVGKKLNLGSLLKINGDVTAVTWYTSNKLIAKVSSKGIVTGIRPGQCKIMVKAVNGKKDVCVLNVYASKGEDGAETEDEDIAEDAALADVDIAND